MLGTLAAGLEVRGIKLASDAVTADVEGFNELRDGIPVLTRIHVRYRLRLPPGSREAADRALARHQAKCPTAQRLAPTIAITWTADISEAQG